MEALKNILSELERDLLLKQEHYEKTMKDISYDSSRLSSEETDIDQLVRISRIIERQIALAREIETIKYHIAKIKIEIDNFE